MSYQNLIDTNLNRAFNLLKDLATDVTLIKKSDVDFDFNLAVVTGDADLGTTIKMVVIDSNKASEEGNI